MTGLITYFAHKLDLKKHASHVPTGLVKLADMKSAVVFLSGNDVDTSRLVSDMHKCFDNLGMKLSIYALNLDKKQHIGEGGVDAVFIHRNHINIFGRIRRNKKLPAIDLESDLFISLIDEPAYPVEREARCSKAKLKIGRQSLDFYDIVVEDSPEVPSSQSEAFRKMIEILKKIV